MLETEALTNTDGTQTEMHLYEALYAVSEKMLKAAKAGQWEDIKLDENKHQALCRRLEESDGRASSGPRELGRKAEQIEGILLMNKELQGLIACRMKVLQDAYREERTIARSYGAQSV
ncbi:MAG: flagellar protein FliT [Nitrospiria bacterium]